MAGETVAMVRPIDTLRGMLDRSKGEIARALPRHLTADRMIRVALTAAQQTPGLLECDPVSIVGGVLLASELGLELSGPLGHCYLIPRWNKHLGRKTATFQVGYKGLLNLASRSPHYLGCSMQCVHDEDAFDYRYGTAPRLDHRPADGDRGEITHVYAVMRTKGGADFEVMSAADINAHRDRYAGSVKADSPWSTAWPEMAKKTVLRRLLKRAELSVEVSRAAAIDEYEEAGLPRDESATLALTQQERSAVLRERIGAARRQPEAGPEPAADAEAHTPGVDDPILDGIGGE